jgi:predicted ATPase
MRAAIAGPDGRGLGSDDLRARDAPRDHRGQGPAHRSASCEKPLGARDYLAIAKRYQTLFVDCIPVMGPEKRNEAKRFILLVDTLYDNGMRLVASADAAPEAIYQGRSGTEAFEFERIASRLNEMQSREWLARFN